MDIETTKRGRRASDGECEAHSERARRRRAKGDRTRSRDDARAIEAMRHMLGKFASAREGLRGMVRAMDDGRGVATSGVEDARVREYLEYFFEHAGMRKSKSSKAWKVPDSKDLRLWRRFHFVFDEEPSELRERYRDAREPWLGPDPEVIAVELAKKEEARAEKAARSRSLGEVRILTGDEAHAFMAERDGSGSDDEGTLGGIGPAVRPPSIGPAIGPSAVDAVPARRVYGPMVPPKSMLEAAAAAAAMSDSIGPPPPEVVAEMEDTSNETREACAKRIMRIIVRGGDAYDMLSAKPDDTAAIIKKKYWKLSLMVHPDKCSHADARSAFDAIKKAHNALSDEYQRKEIDAKRNEADERKEFETWLAGERQAAAWRRLKGNPLPGDDELLDGPGKVDGDRREEWMTHLPPEKRPNPGPPTANVTSFSKTEKVARTVEMEAAWTDTPQQAAAREQQLFLAAQAKHYALPAAGISKVDETSRLVDEFNHAHRAKSMMEIHTKKREKKEKKENKGNTIDGESGKSKSTWEYRPFNRDTDLKLQKEGTMKPDEALKRAGGGLGERFGGGKSAAGVTGRSFL